MPDGNTPATQFVAHLPLDAVAPSPFNPRATMPEDELRALGESLRVNQLQPIVVRPLVDSTTQRVGDVENGAQWQIIAGHRRVAAARLVGLTHLQAVIRTATDAEVKTAHLVENLQREALQALEEAEGYRRLRDDEGLTGDEIAQRVGRKPGVVYARLKLLELVPEARTALANGDIPTEIALLIARIPLAKLQQRALVLCREVNAIDRGHAGVRTLRDAILEKFTLDLAKAIFDTQDATLLPTAGACTACPKRTGGAPDLFADFIRPDGARYYGKKGEQLCTDPDCFEAKRKAHLARQAEALRAKGKTVVIGSSATVSADGEVKGAYVAYNALKEQLAKVKAKTPDKLPEVVTIIDHRTGKPKQAVKREEAKAAGVKLESSERAGPQRTFEAQQQQMREARERREKERDEERARRLALFNAARAVYASQPRTLGEARLVALELRQHLDHLAEEANDALRGWKSPKQAQTAIAAMDGQAIGALLVDLVLLQEVYAWDITAPTPGLDLVRTTYGVELPAPPTEPAAQAKRGGGAAGKAGKGAARGAKGKAKKTAPAVAGEGDETDAEAGDLDMVAGEEK
jgi:ParB/RepB/Spo0J family partition protein